MTIPNSDGVFYIKVPFWVYCFVKDPNDPWQRLLKCYCPIDLMKNTNGLK